MLEQLNYSKGNIEEVLSSSYVSGDVKALAYSYTCDRVAIKHQLPKILNEQTDHTVKMKIAALMAIYELTYFRDLDACRNILGKLRALNYNDISGFESELIKSAYNFVNLLVDDFEDEKADTLPFFKEERRESYSIIGDSHIIGLSIAAPKVVNTFYLPGIRYKHISGRLPNAKLTGLANALIFSQNISNLVFSIGEIDVRMAQINSQKGSCSLDAELSILLECFSGFCVYVRKRTLPHQNVKIIIPPCAGQHLFDYKSQKVENILGSFYDRFKEISMTSGFSTINPYSGLGTIIGIPEDSYLDWAHYRAEHYQSSLQKILG